VKWFLGGAALWHLVAGGKPAAGPFARPCELVGPNAITGAPFNVRVEEADAFVLSDERGPVLHLLFVDHVGVSVLKVVLEPPRCRVKVQCRRLSVGPLVEAKAVLHLALLSPRVVLKA